MFNQMPPDHIGEPGQFSQLCPCYQCAAYVAGINAALRANLTNRPRELNGAADRVTASCTEIRQPKP